LTLKQSSCICDCIANSSGENGSSQIGHARIILSSKRAFVQNLSYENEFDLHENEPVGRKHFHMNGFARRLVLTHRQKHALE